MSRIPSSPYRRVYPRRGFSSTVEYLTDCLKNNISPSGWMDGKSWEHWAEQAALEGAARVVGWMIDQRPWPRTIMAAVRGMTLANRPKLMGVVAGEFESLNPSNRKMVGVYAEQAGNLGHTELAMLFAENGFEQGLAPAIAQAREEDNAFAVLQLISAGQAISPGSIDRDS